MTLPRHTSIREENWRRYLRSKRTVKREDDEAIRKADNLLCHASHLSCMEAHARTPADTLAHCTDRCVHHGFKRDKAHSDPGLWRQPAGFRREHREASGDH